MNDDEILQIQREIDSLPKGSITVKRINGKEYEYWQFRENGRQITRRVKGEELDTLRVRISERKRLEQLLKKAGEKKQAGNDPVNRENEGFHSLIRIGDDLMRFAEPVKDFRKREIFDQLEAYLNSPGSDRVFILYGLRRTGKTTMIRQAVLTMEPDMRNRTAFIQISPDQTLASLNQDLKLLEAAGIRYVFIDEVTLLADFIEGAALFSDIFAASGMKIVLSGTDSLGFMFAEDEQLYDRCFMLHTTFIPYREFERVLGIRGIDQYIRYGGTMSLGGVDYNMKEMPFSSEKRTYEYVDSAIARNIQHSLRNYQYEGHFRALYDLYERNELTGAINRVVEDMNHRFTLDVLTRAFVSHDLGVSKTNMRMDRENPTDILDHIDEAAVTERLRILLEIRDRDEQTVVLSEEHVREIREYLEILDLIRYVDIEFAGSSQKTRKRTVFTQPGLRYAQAEALITTLMQDETFRDIGIRECMRITRRILDEIRGRMMEDIILLETSISSPEKKVFALQFASGEFDMVCFDPDSVSCGIFEIKHSSQMSPGQYRHLTDADKIAQTEHQYGDITGKYVIYNGEDSNADGIRYLNAEEYLLGLKTKTG